MIAQSMEEIIAKLKKASGPDRELDFAIFMQLAYAIQPTSPHPKDRDDAPHYTASIITALTLVPEGWTRSVDATAPDAGIRVDLFPPDKDRHGNVWGDHKSEAIATCIAALQARKP